MVFLPILGFLPVHRASCCFEHVSIELFDFVHSAMNYCYLIYLFAEKKAAAKKPDGVKKVKKAVTKKPKSDKPKAPKASKPKTVSKPKAPKAKKVVKAQKA